MAKTNRICSVCKRPYHYCPTCMSDANKPTWMAVFCCENCKDIYNAINDYRYKSLSKKDALNKLNTLDLSPVDKLPENFKSIFKEIFEESNIKETKIELITEEIVEEVINESILEPVVEDTKEKDITVSKFISDEINTNEVIKEEIVRPRPKKKVKSVE